MSEIIQPPLSDTQLNSPTKTEDELKKQEIDEFKNDEYFIDFFKLDQDKEELINKNKYVLYLIYYYLSKIDTKYPQYKKIKLNQNQFTYIIEHIELTNNHEYAPIKIPLLLECFNSTQLYYLNECILFDDIKTYPKANYILELSSILTLHNIVDFKDKAFITEKSKNKDRFIHYFFLENRIFKVNNSEEKDRLIIRFIYNSIRFLNKKGMIKEYLIYYFIHILSSYESSIFKFTWILYYLDFASLALLIPK